MNQLSAGAAKVNITPPVGVYQAGFGQKEPTLGIHDDLYAKALVLSNDDVKTVIVTMDTLGLDAGLTLRIKKLLREETGIQDILLTASHTHSGPSIGPWHGEFAEKDPVYIDALCRKIVEAVCLANDDMIPVKVKSGRGYARIGANRRPINEDGKVTAMGENPEGPVDTDVPILVLERANGTMLALLLTYPCHAIAAGAPPYISADYPGYTQRFLEDKLGCTVLFTQGAGADINPIGYMSERSFERAETYGEELGKAVLSAINSMEKYETNPCLMVAGKKMLIPVREEAFSSDIPTLLRRRKKENAEWIEGRKLSYEIYVMRMGSCLFVGLESEPVVEIGLDIKNKVFAKHGEIKQAFIIGYAGNSSYYVSVPRMFEEGGYEYEETLLVREASSVIVNSVISMVDSMYE